ncbi:MAG: spermidine synthase family protein [Planctomycetota bacterium]|jgi:spermidine synthase
MPVHAGKSTFLAFFLLCLSTLMFEILLTRILSVTMWYHFAFVAISLALFGMTAGAMAVYLLPNFFRKERAAYHLGLAAFLFCLTMTASLLIHLNLQVKTWSFEQDSGTIKDLLVMALTFIVMAVPFLFSGVAVCIALTRFPRQISRLYATDLAGAAFGCWLIIPVIDLFGGPGSVLAVSCLAGLSALLFLLDFSKTKLRYFALASCLLFAGIATVAAVMNASNKPLLRLGWIKGHEVKAPEYEKWNSFSRIAIFEEEERKGQKLMAWGLSPAYKEEESVRQRRMNIDASAGTVLTGYSGKASELEHLKHDLTNLVHYIREDAQVLIIGMGAGRDILSALAFGQKEVVAVDINEEIIHAVTGPYGEFSGHLDRQLGVTIVKDEARSYIARQERKFDIIQSSLIDTWAATAQGAFTLTENSLYTVEAWKTFLDRLNPEGVLTFSRWYIAENPAETYRLLSLAVQSLKECGVTETRNNIIIAKSVPPRVDYGICTVLVSRDPFSKQDIAKVKEACSRMHFDVVLTPEEALNDTFARIADGKDLERLYGEYLLDISPPVDDRPFFFHMTRLRDAFGSTQGFELEGRITFNMQAVFVLATFLLVTLGLSLAFVFVPLVLTYKRASFTGSAPLFFYFAAIGLGFMLIEISQMQRLMVFLGHPVYGLAVLLFALLLSSGLGSLFTDRVKEERLAAAAATRFAVLLVLLVGIGLSTRFLTDVFQASSTMVRIIVATLTIFPMGFFMGMAFPLGMRIAQVRWSGLAPWFWGINGTTSVCASVVAVAVSISYGISATFWCGAVTYLAALLAALWLLARSGK